MFFFAYWQSKRSNITPYYASAGAADGVTAERFKSFRTLFHNFSPFQAVMNQPFFIAANMQMSSNGKIPAFTGDTGSIPVVCTNFTTHKGGVSSDPASAKSSYRES